MDALNNRSRAQRNAPDVGATGGAIGGAIGNGGARFARSGPVPSTPHRRLTSSDILAGAREVLIHHNGMEYRLRRTSADKLILTK